MHTRIGTPENVRSRAVGLVASFAAATAAAAAAAAVLCLMPSSFWRVVKRYRYTRYQVYSSSSRRPLLPGAGY